MKKNENEVLCIQVKVTHQAISSMRGGMMKFFIAAILAPLTLVGCSHEVTVADLESFEITVSTQDDVLRKVGQPNKKLDAGDLIVYAYKIDDEEYVLNFVNTPDGYRFLKTSKLNDEFRNYLKEKFENLTEEPFPLAWQ